MCFVDGNGGAYFSKVNFSLWNHMFCVHIVVLMPKLLSIEKTKLLGNYVSQCSLTKSGDLVANTYSINDCNKSVPIKYMETLREVCNHNGLCL